MNFSRWKYRILLTLFSIPLAYVVTAGITSFYDKYIRTRSDPNDMKLDCIVVMVVAGGITLILFPILGYLLGRKVDLVK